MTIKKVTKKRFNQLMGLIENDLPIGSNPPVDPMKTLRNYIKADELGGKTIDVPPDIHHWWDLFVYLVCIMVRSELAYDPTMGSQRDLNLIVETVNIQLKKWKRESVLKKFARRKMIIHMGDRFLKRS